MTSSDVVEGDLGQEPPEPGPPLAGPAALAQVAADGRDPVAGPPERDGPVGQGVPAGGGSLVVENLLRSRLRTQAMACRPRCHARSSGDRRGSLTAGLLAASGRVGPREGSAEQFVELLLPVGG